MEFTPLWRWIHIELEPSVEEGELSQKFYMPEEILGKERYVVARVVYPYCDCDIEFAWNERIVVDSTMVETFNIGEKAYAIIQVQHVIGKLTKC